MSLLRVAWTLPLGACLCAGLVTSAEETARVALEIERQEILEGLQEKEFSRGRLRDHERVRAAQGEVERREALTELELRELRRERAILDRALAFERRLLRDVRQTPRRAGEGIAAETRIERRRLGRVVEEQLRRIRRSTEERLDLAPPRSSEVRTYASPAARAWLESRGARRGLRSR